MNKISENAKWFRENHKKLYELYPNKYLVIVDKKVVEKFDSSHDAFIFARSKYKYGEFNISKCTYDIYDLLL